MKNPRPIPDYCECKTRRRSDCRRGEDCRALAVKLHASPAPRWVGVRLVISAGIAVGLALLGLALSSCWWEIHR